MKKFMKVTAVIGAISLLLGMIAILIGTVFGGMKELKAKGKDEIVSLLKLPQITRMVEHNGGIEIIDGVNISFGNSSVGNNVFDKNQTKYTEGTFTFDDIAAENLEIIVGAGDLEVKYHEAETVKLEIGSGDRMQCYVTNNTLKIVGSVRNNFHGGSNMVLYLPADVSYNNVIVDVSAGSFTADMIAGNQIKVDVGMGNVVIDEIEADKLEVSVGMGNVEVRGEAKGDVTIDCGMGQVTMELTGDGKEYNYELDCGMGSLNVEDVCNISGIGDQNVDNGASKEIEVSVGMGNVEVSFRE